MLLRYFVNDSEKLPVASVINCITSVFNSTNSVFPL
jgi:hypothetical protein